MTPELFEERCAARLRGIKAGTITLEESNAEAIRDRRELEAFLSDLTPEHPTVIRVAAALKAAAEKAGWYGLDNYTFEEVALIALEAAQDVSNPVSTEPQR